MPKMPHLNWLKKNALPLKYKREDWHPRRQAKISDFVDKAALKRFISSDMIQVKKKFVQIADRQASVPNHNVGD